MFKNKFLIVISIISLSLILSACNSTPTTSKSSEIKTNSEAKVAIYFFWGENCPHCTTQKVFLDEMQDKYPDLEIKSFETWKSPANAQILQKMAQAYGTRASGVPMTFIGDFEPTVGFSSQMKEAMEEKIIYCLEEGCSNPGDKINN
jgi:thiol-disulfide isomerase/thioredoxin